MAVITLIAIDEYEAEINESIKVIGNCELIRLSIENLNELKSLYQAHKYTELANRLGM
jgi:hypothetical protein